MARTFRICLLIINFVAFSTASLLRFTNACPECPSLTFHVDGNPTFSSVEHMQVTHYAELNAGRKQIYVTAKIGGNEKRLLDFGVFLQREPITIAAINCFPRVDYLILKECSDLFHEVGKTYLRFVNLSPNSPGIDLVDSSFKTIFQNATYLSHVEHVPFASGIEEFSVQETSSGTELTKIPETHFYTKREYTVFLFGDANGGMGSFVSASNFGSH